MALIGESFRAMLYDKGMIPLTRYLAGRENVDHVRGGAAALAKGAAVTAIVVLTSCYAAHRASAPNTLAPPQELIGAIKKVENTLGFHRTNNFLHYSSESVVDYRCYYTGKLELPESYEGLHLRSGTKDGCAVDPERYDVFFYPMQAMANGRSPVTVSLANSSIERVLMVVPHEDFHEGRHKLPASINEAAATLVGFLTANEVAREKFGTDSEVYRKLSKEPGLFLQKAEIVNRYYVKLNDLYAAAGSGEIPKQSALELKQDLFARLGSECQAISPNPGSFNKCLSANNNAGLAFDSAYAKYYPLMYELFMAQGQDLKSTIDAITQALSARSAPETLLRIRDLIKHAHSHLPS